ncbi:MAG: hypothetical protein IJT54_01830 [Candidatus Methanomethylophilaceae archaeon]|nr:hypothetical protein [Candidatus Methanomethylophilaceae archaeon]
MASNQQVNVRLSVDELRQIDAMVENGDFGNRVEFVKYATRKVLRQLQEGERIGFKPEM